MSDTSVKLAPKNLDSSLNGTFLPPCQSTLSRVPTSPTTPQNAPVFPIAKSISTDHDPDHRSYTRHIESSESARPVLSRPLLKSRVSGTLSEMSSFLSASSSLSGSTQHPCENDEDEDEADDNNSIHSEDRHKRSLQLLSRNSPTSSERTSQTNFSSIPAHCASNLSLDGTNDCHTNNASSENLPSTSEDTRSLTLDFQDLMSPTIRTSSRSSINSPHSQGQSREHMTTHQVVQHHAQQQQNKSNLQRLNYHNNSNNNEKVFRSQSADPHAILSRPQSSNSKVRNGTSSSTKRLRFNHYHKPRVTDSPRLVFLCQQFINNGDAESLAVIARRRGLPPKLRHMAWPLLLANHPYVLKPNLCIDSMSPPISKDLVPTKRITNEISRYQKKKKLQQQAINGKRNTLFSSSTPSSTTNTTVTSLNGSEQPPVQSNGGNNEEIETLRSFVIQEAIENFLTKWGHVVPYDPGMVYVGFALSEWIDLVPSSSSIPASNENNSHSGFSLVHYFTHLNYQSSISSRASTMSECYDSLPTSPALQAISNTAQGNTNSQEIPDNGQQFSLKSLKGPSHTFSQVFYNLMLVMCHSPEDDEDVNTESANENQHNLETDGDKAKKSSSKPSRRHTGKSTTTDRISFFLSAFRRLLPELADHFNEEDVLSGIGGDEWILYWIKWLGAKVWDKRDCARIWDMHLGWRPDGIKFGDEMFMEKVIQACQLGGGDLNSSSVTNSTKNADGENTATTTLGAVHPLSDTSTDEGSLNGTTRSFAISLTSFIDAHEHNCLETSEASAIVSNDGNFADKITSTAQPKSSGNGEFVVKTPTNQNFTFNWTQLESEIGPDPFWTAGSVLVGKGRSEQELLSSSPSSVDSHESNSSNTTSNNTGIHAPQTVASARSTPYSSTKSSSCSLSSSRYQTTQSSLTKCMDPLTEHLFVCLALLKSKRSTLLELDQSEIRGLLSKLYRSKDIESLISEACEMRRTWDYEEERDEDE